MHWVGLQMTPRTPGGLSPSPPRAPSCPEHRVDCHRRHQEAQGPWHSYKAGASLASTRAAAAACEQRLGWGQLLGGPSPAWTASWGRAVRGEALAE